ncbi:hypothetical protein IH824_18830 [candidate division KSB1 bacterium]|nr:hypothetical protein [candidate division KSB1 bacterium]
MKKKIIVLFALALLIISSASVFAQEGEVCQENEKCDGVIGPGGVCLGECVSVEENTCSFLSFSIACIIGKTLDSFKAKAEDVANNIMVSLLGFDLFTTDQDFLASAKGNEKLWQFSYSLSFLIATFLLITTTISYFKESLNPNSNVEILSSMKNQLFKLVIMFNKVKNMSSFLFINMNPEKLIAQFTTLIIQYANEASIGYEEVTLGRKQTVQRV